MTTDRGNQAGLFLISYQLRSEAESHLDFMVSLKLNLEHLAIRRLKFSFVLSEIIITMKKASLEAPALQSHSSRTQPRQINWSLCGDKGGLGAVKSPLVGSEA